MNYPAHLDEHEAHMIRLDSHLDADAQRERDAEIGRLTVTDDRVKRIEKKSLVAAIINIGAGILLGGAVGAFLLLGLPELLR